MEVHLVADTNLFFECKTLEQLPWDELGHDPVVILLTKPVLDEIDKHKKANGRTRARALDIFGRVRGMLMLSEQEVEIRPSAPRVLLRRMANVMPNPMLRGALDYTKTDEKLIGIASALNATASGYDVKLFTDDTGPAATADDLDVPYLMINENWRRPPTETTEEKKIKELEKDLGTYRAQEPKISIETCEGANEQNVVEVTRKIATPLTEVEIEGYLEALRLKHPLVTDFTPPPSSSTTDYFGEVTNIEYTSPEEGDIAGYRDVAYPQWIQQCRKVLLNLHEGRDEIEPPVVLRWPMSNKGTRPASQVRIEFEATGPLELRRFPFEIDDDADIDASTAASQGNVASVKRFPSPPIQPPFQKHATRIPAPARPKPVQGFDIAELAAHASLGDYSKKMAEVSKALGLLDLKTNSEHFRILNGVAEASKLMQPQLSIFDTPGFNSIFKASVFAAIPDHVAYPLRLSQIKITEPHDPEAFYYDWPMAQQVKKVASTCDLWRHQAGEEVFEFMVVFTNEGATRGTVQCTVHAENLTKPEQARVIVGRRIESFSMMSLANMMVENCK
jgi:hypothetical protein